MNFNSSALRNMSLRDQTILVVLLAMILIFGFYQVVIKSKVVVVNALKGQLQQQQTILNNSQQELQAMPDPDAAFVQLQEQMDRVHTLLPDSDEINELLGILNATGKEQRVRIASIKQGTPVDKKSYYAIPIEMTVTGTYTDLLQFINKLESLRRFNAITKVSVQSAEDLLSAQLAAVVYVYGPMPQSNSGPNLKKH